MQFNRQPGQTARARNLRQQENPAEASLWSVLRNRQLAGHKFVRQMPIGPFYADFVCRAEMLVVEVDGSQHVDNAYDVRRDAFICGRGYRVLRVPSGSVLRRRDGVCDAILAVWERRLDQEVDAEDMKLRLPSPASLARGCPLP